MSQFRNIRIDEVDEAALVPALAAFLTAYNEHDGKGEDPISAERDALRAAIQTYLDMMR